MNFERPFDRHKFDIKTAAPFGMSPDGHWITSVEELPDLPIPWKVTVTREQLVIDGWVFPLAYVSKSLLVWLQQSFLRWIEEDDRPKNRQWVGRDRGSIRRWSSGEIVRGEFARRVRLLTLSRRELIRSSRAFLGTSLGRSRAQATCGSQEGCGVSRYRPGNRSMATSMIGVDSRKSNTRVLLSRTSF